MVWNAYSSVSGSSVYRVHRYNMPASLWTLTDRLSWGRAENTNLVGRSSSRLRTGRCSPWQWLIPWVWPRETMMLFGVIVAPTAPATSSSRVVVASTTPMTSTATARGSRTVVSGNFGGMGVRWFLRDEGMSRV
ncbi:hypothetical protein L1887_35544 [Cichorium endivia]|nr:hypothetical protein L1887_35544 [Cichorium endivia]